MKIPVKLSLLWIILILLSPWRSLAQPAPPSPGDDETLWEYFLSLGEASSALAAQPVVKGTEARVEAKTTATAAPEGFAGRVNDVISDFLPFFQFAVNGISTSEDGRSLTLKLNPFDLGHFGPVSWSATATEPQVFDPFAQKIVEPAREAEVKALLGEVDDFSDLTLAFEYGYSRPAAGWNRDRKLFGRKTEAYRPLIQELLAAGLAEIAPPQEAFSKAITPLNAQAIEIFEATGKRDLRSLTFKELRSLIVGKKVETTESDLLAQLNAAVPAWKDLENNISALNLAALPELIDNQPQLVVKGTFREADPVVGPDTQAVSLTYEMGTRNLNAVLREYRALKAESSELNAGVNSESQRQIEQSLRLKALGTITSSEDLASEDRYVFSITYKDTDPYDFSRDYTESVSSADATEPVEVPRNASLSLPGSTEWVGRLTWTRFLRSRRMRGTDLLRASNNADLTLTKVPEPEEKPRLSLTLERFEVSGNPKLQDRTVGRLTLTLPAPGNMTLPISITYADKSEFLGEQDRTFGAHVGISYKVNR
jgi:hypothetical protein